MVKTCRWTGTIANNTPEPEDEGKYTAGKPGNPCPGSGFTPGTQRTKKDAKTKWDVSSYNDAVKNAFQWAKDMEKTIIIAIVGTDPGPSAASIIENT